MGITQDYGRKYVFIFVLESVSSIHTKYHVLNPNPIKSIFSVKIGAGRASAQCMDYIIMPSGAICSYMETVTVPLLAYMQKTSVEK
ncbi:hypothetical protein TSUD_44920 [Trifolium subterraneum]|nr:hypothetical protein TSUD_44920 [Trifolium subterraneum]